MAKAMNLERDPIPSLLAEFSIPAITGMLVNALYNVVDRIFIGQGVGDAAFSSLAVTAPLAIIIMAFSMLVGFGSAPLISIHLGEKNRDAAEQVLGNGVALLCGLSLLIAVLGNLYMRPILLFLGGSPETLGYAAEYMSIIYLGVVFQMLGFGLTHMMRASGNPRASMQTMLLGAIMNMILDPVFIFGFGWGIAGAAYATIISQFASMIYVLNYFLGAKSVLKIQPRHFRTALAGAPRIFAVGVSSFFTQVAMSVVASIANHQIRTHGGDMALGAMGIITSFGMLFLMPIFGLNQGAQPIIGYNYGAKRFDRVKQTLRYTVCIASAVCLSGWLLVELAPGLVIALFTQSPEITGLARGALRTYYFFLPVVGAQLLCAVFFQAIGQAGKTLILSMLRQVILLIPAYFVLPAFFGLKGVWMAGPTADILSACITACVFFYYIRKLGAGSAREVAVEETA